jgi:16S rRNA (guanine1207-N2)-methyltransferase
MSPALETLLLPFSPKSGLAVPSRALFIGAEPHPDLRHWHAITGWQPFKPLADRWEREGFARIDDLPQGERWPVVLILPGKCRDENLAWFALARDHLEPGGKLVAAMPNAIGAARYEKTLAQATGGIGSIQKNKCRAFFVTEDGTWDEKTFDQWRELARRRPIPDTDYVTEPGVFSSDHIDPGSQLLADHLPDDLSGAVADLGGGWGFLSAEALRRCPAIERLDLFEADSRALDCARQNLAPHASKHLIAWHWHDVRAGLPGQYDVIVMNPPFHTGHATNVDLGRAFLLVAIAALNPGGRLFLVANRQLPYEPVLDAGGLTWRKLAESTVHKVIAAQRQ